MTRFRNIDNPSLPPHCLKIDNNVEFHNLVLVRTEWFKWHIEHGGGELGSNILVFTDKETKLLFLLKFQN